MKLKEVDPFIRFAGKFNYLSKGSERYLPDCRLHYILGGSGEIIIKNQHFMLMPDTAVFCRSGSIYNIISEAGIDIIAINFDLTKNNSHITVTRPPVPIDRHNAYTVIGGETIDDSEALSDFCVIYSAEHIKQFVAKLLEEYEKDTELARCSAETYLKLALFTIEQNNKTVCSASEKMLKRVVDHIDAHYKEELSNKALASLCGYHEYYFSKIFQKYTGFTPHSYIVKKRLSEAKKLLLESSDTLENIADELGFSAGTHFSVSFKKEFGLTPAQYRKYHKTNI